MIERERKLEAQSIAGGDLFAAHVIVVILCEFDDANVRCLPFRVEVRAENATVAAVIASQAADDVAQRECDGAHFTGENRVVSIYRGVPENIYIDLDYAEIDVQASASPGLDDIFPKEEVSHLNDWATAP